MKFSQLDTFDDVYQPLICILAVVREAVTVKNLHNWTQVQPQDIRRALSDWREFLQKEVDDGESMYRLYHSSFQEFLAYMVDLSEYNRLIAKYYYQMAMKIE